MVVESIFVSVQWCTFVCSSTLGVTKGDNLHVEYYRVLINVSIRCHKYLKKIIHFVLTMYNMVNMVPS